MNEVMTDQNAPHCCECLDAILCRSAEGWLGPTNAAGYIQGSVRLTGPANGDGPPSERLFLCTCFKYLNDVVHAHISGAT